MQLLFDFFPLIAFFAAYKFWGIFVATGVIIAAVLLQTSIQWVRHRKVSTMALVSAALVLVFGGLTLWIHDEACVSGSYRQSQVACGPGGLIWRG